MNKTIDNAARTGHTVVIARNSGVGIGLPVYRRSSKPRHSLVSGFFIAQRIEPMAGCARAPKGAPYPISGSPTSHKPVTRLNSGNRFNQSDYRSSTMSHALSIGAPAPAVNNQPVQTMSSLEIAELTGKTHRNVLADIRKILTEAEINAADFSATQKYGKNNYREVFNLPRLECDLVISGYSVKYRYAIIKRWHELETKTPQALPSPTPEQYGEVTHINEGRWDSVVQRYMTYLKVITVFTHGATKTFTAPKDIWERLYVGARINLINGIVVHDVATNSIAHEVAA